MAAILLMIIMILISILFIFIFRFESKDEKGDMMCIEKCNREDCEYCVDREQCTFRNTEV
ncbi:MAG: hypothetical protein ACLSV2_11905 [Clostridium sp.]